MRWIEKLNDALNYIEDNLENDIDLDEIASISECSIYHFQRMFSYMSSIPLFEYIRQRRMSLAAQDLINGMKVIDVALKYGYESPTSFNRAFKSVHGIAPSLAKKEGAKLKMHVPINFIITIKGASAMDYKIESNKSFRVVGYSIDIEMDLEENFKKVPSFWNEVMSDGRITKLSKLMSQDFKAVLGIVDFRNEKGKYYIGVVSEVLVDSELQEIIIPQQKWAKFSEEGTDKTIKELERRIYSEWLPNSGYEYSQSLDIEIYKNPDPNNVEYEVWVPIK